MKELTCNIENGVLKINDQITNLKADFFKALITKSGVVAGVNKLLDGSIGTPARNIYLLNEKGKVLWQIEEFKFGTEPQYYVNFWLDESGNLRAFVPKGFDCHIDIKTGKIMSSEFTK